MNGDDPETSSRQDRDVIDEQFLDAVRRESTHAAHPTGCLEIPAAAEEGSLDQRAIDLKFARSAVATKFRYGQGAQCESFQLLFEKSIE
jgi:hypothetical protein